MKKIDREIYEYGECERDFARLASFAPHGGWFARFCKWMERLAREQRELLIEERNEDRERGNS